MNHSVEVRSGERFEFGANWQLFLDVLNDKRITEAEAAMREMLGDIRGKTFLDVGCGSGLHSLIAHRLGATVHAFDYDPQSVACTKELQRRYLGDWRTEEGSALDPDYLRALGKFDIVYSWGVLRHTGDMWKALANVSELVAPNGRLFIAIYNDQGRRSRAWRAVKHAYNKLGFMRWLVFIPAFLYLYTPSILRDIAIGKPFATWKRGDRGMSAWTDAIDWVGGYPFEVATPAAIFDFYRKLGFSLEHMTTLLGHGCNEFVFRRNHH